METESNNQYAPPKSAVADVEPAGEAFNRADRGSRLVAVILDSLIGTVAFIPAYVAAFSTLLAHQTGNTFAIWSTLAGTGLWFFFGAIAALTVLGINIYLMRKYGQTIGKRIVGVRIVGTDGSHVPLSRIFFIRYLLNTVITMIPKFGGLYALVDALMIFGEQRRCVHDYMANTIVIKA